MYIKITKKEVLSSTDPRNFLKMKNVWETLRSAERTDRNTFWAFERKNKSGNEQVAAVAGGPQTTADKAEALETPNVSQSIDYLTACCLFCCSALHAASVLKGKCV